ncbi:MAG: right-handed parallel beta-helix repeat-containing protein [Candidatus Bathyarchaeia archaeon]
MKKQSTVLVILLAITLNIFSFIGSNFVSFVNATYVEGNITQDTTWTLVDSPFIVSNNITVYSNATLTIEPGVEVRFGGDFWINVSGRLYANGTGNMIVFTSNKEQPTNEDWSSILFTGTGKSVLVNCHISYAKNAIGVVNSDAEIENCVFSNCQNAITAVNGKLTFKNSVISFGSQNGVNILDCDSTIINNQITQNSENGIYLTGNGQVTIQNNSLLANGNGILLTGSDASNVHISQNIISANTQSGIRIDASTHSNITIINNSIASNHRGFHISTSQSTQITNNSISYNGIGFLYDSGNHIAKWNDIYDNADYGMTIENDATVIAEYNYWGASNGPYHETLNPTGRGNKVGGNGVNLDFIFFSTKPFGVINQRPTANLAADKLWVPRNADVMFFGTNSYDPDGRVDKYLFDFGDGSNSGWTTLSIFSHKYSAEGIYLANLRVIDDYGALSNVAFVTITVISSTTPQLHVNLELSNSSVSEGEQISVTVYVTNGTAPVQGASVTMLSFKEGNFSQSSGSTNTTGYFITNFTAPDVTERTSVRIVARATKNGIQYADGSDYEYLQVSPFLSVQITANPQIIKSEETSQITIYVESNGEPVANASVTLSSNRESLSPQTGTTNLNGILSAVFTAPQTTTLLNVDITAVATKDRYMSGIGYTTITVEPKVLAVEITAAPNATTISEAKLNVTVHVEYDANPVSGANVTITADGGYFSTSSELTDNYGNVTFFYTAPPVSEQTNIIITAYATATGYAGTESQLEITINPRTFNILIVAPSVESGKTAMVTVIAVCNEDGTSVAGATVTMSSTDGSFEIITQTTDSTGACVFTFNAPITSSNLNVTLTANVVKEGYIPGESQTTITVLKAAPSGDGGWLWTLLLILIPVVIVIIVVVLIKLKIIVISHEEET